MPKNRVNSVDYNSLIGSDLKNMTLSHKGPRRPSLFIISLTVALIVVISVVLTQNSQSTPASLNLANTNVKSISLILKPVVDSTKKQAGIASNNPSATFKESIVAKKAETFVSSEEVNRVTVIVKKGDTLSSIFSELDIHTELTRILNLGKKAKPFKKIYPGQRLHFTFSENRIDKLELEKSITESLLLYNNNESFALKEFSRELDRISQIASGTIVNSLFLAGQDTGMSDGLIMDMAGIFGWDIDFALDIREGDSFTVLYEELYLDGIKVGDGNIIAAEFNNRGNTYRAYRYTDSSNKTEYYSPDGKSMRKPFMRTPVALGRISSHFNLKRKHPILNKIRAHKGVDYAAPTGTAIKATGDGKVIYRGTKGGYGKTIVLRHGNTYTTLYAHMSKYSRGTRVGNHVRQGQTIGYVGSTGLATGPHLHYEFRIHGVHRNPLRVKLPSAKPLPVSEVERFRTVIQPLLVQLDAYTQNALVMRDL